MKELTQDNDPLPFLTLAACTRNVMEFLKLQNQKHHDTDRADDRANERQNEEQKKRRGEAVERRLKEIADFERRASGQK